MKIAVLAVLLGLCICFVHSIRITNWGTVHGRSLGTEKIVIKSLSSRIRTHTFTYPRNNSTAPIVGIKHLDNKSHPVNVTFLRGYIGTPNVTIRIDSQRGHGIDSTFVFYT